MIKLAIDFENPGKEWWQSGGQELWDSIAEGFDNNVVEAARIPGWMGGPEWSPHPVCLKPVDEDEIV